jgi:ankyrin repeat protein
VRCNVDVQEEDGYTPIHFAARNEQETVTKQLIATRCNVNLQDEDGWTTVHPSSS